MIAPRRPDDFAAARPICMQQDAAKPHEPPADLIELGRIVTAHGVRGQVKVLLHDATSNTLAEHKTWWLRAASAALAEPPAPHPVRVLSCQRHAEVLLAQLEGVNDRDRAQSLKGTTLHLPRSAFPKAADDEYYWVDLIGCAVHGHGAGTQDALLGQVVQVSDNGAHALLHVRAAGAQPGAEEPREQLIPFVAAHILRVALSERRIDSNWPADF